MKLLFCGDFVPGGMLHYQKEYVSTKFLDYIHDFDIRICTLECAIGTDIPYDEAKRKSTNAIVYSTDEDFYRIKELGFDIVSLANNHITDLGKEGLENTIKKLDENGILHFGAGMNYEEAKRPSVITLEETNIAFIGCLFQGVAPTIFHAATENEYGVYQTDLETIQEDIRLAKEKYDKVIVMPHWAQEYNYMPPIYCYDYAKKMIDAGADAIIASHPHIVNPRIKYKGKDIYFSLGNFLFPDICLEVPRPMCYPKKNNDVLNLPKVWAYPSGISQPSIAVWKKCNRVGMIVDFTIDKKSKTYHSEYKLVLLGYDNILRLYEGVASLLVKFRLSLFALCIKHPKYSFIRRMYLSRWNIIRRIKRKLENKIENKRILTKE